MTHSHWAVSVPVVKTPWPHAPPHWLFTPGVFMVTCGTLDRAHLLDTPARLDLVQDLLFTLAREFGWTLQAWAVLRNHYHFVATSPPGVDGAKSLPRLLGKLHMISAREINRQDDTPGRKVWFQFWESCLTFEKSRLARLRYVHQNAVHHGIVERATDYRWCSAAWFESRAPMAFVKAVRRFKTDQLNVPDDF